MAMHTSLGRRQRLIAALVGTVLCGLAATTVLLRSNDAADDGPSGASVPEPAQPPAEGPTQRTAGPSQPDDPVPSGPPETDSDGDGQTSTPTTSSSTATGDPPPTTPPVPLEPLDADTAATTVTDLLEATERALSAPPDEATNAVTELEELTAGVVLAEVEALRAEYDAMGWTQIGTPTIVDLRVTTPPTAEAPAEVTVEVCLDSSDVKVVDSDGNDVRFPGAPSRSLNIYVFRWSSDRWVAAEHTFPEDPDC